MLCSQGPSLRLVDRASSLSSLEKQFEALDFSCIYERKAKNQMSYADHGDNASAHFNCPSSRDVSSGKQPKQNRHSACVSHKDFFPSLEAINEEQSETDNSVVELGMKYDLTLPDRHYHQAKNMGYLHRKGRHYRRTKCSKENNDFPRRERSVTF